MKPKEEGITEVRGRKKKIYSFLLGILLIITLILFVVNRDWFGIPLALTFVLSFFKREFLEVDDD